MALLDVAGKTAPAKHALTLVAARTAAVSAARLATLTGHPPSGGTDLEVGVMCGPCSPGRSRVSWPCWDYRRAANGLVTGLLT